MISCSNITKDGIFTKESIINENIIEGCDSSFSVYSNSYKQGYHSKRLGAYTETLVKHIYPSLFFHHHGSFCDDDVRSYFLQQTETMRNQYKNQNKDFLNHQLQTLKNQAEQNPLQPLRILDICFGLGYNAMLSLNYFKTCEIYSPEKDYLLQELQNFPYHNIPHSKAILSALHKHSCYKHDGWAIYYLHGDALTHILQFDVGFFDIVFQDAFSSQYNPELWDIRYFKQLYRITKSPCIITTYAKARSVIETAKQAGFHTLKYVWGSIFYK